MEKSLMMYVSIIVLFLLSRNFTLKTATSTISQIKFYNIDDLYLEFDSA